MQSTLSEEEGSADSTNGEGEQEGSQKSPGGEKSPGDSSLTSSANPEDEEGGSPCSSQAADPTQSSVPQQFRRETKNTDSTCARTDLVYIHPPAEEKKMATVPSKVGSQPLTIREYHRHEPIMLCQEINVFSSCYISW